MKRFPAALLLIALGSPVVNAQSPFGTTIDSMMAPYARKDGPGAAVLVMQGGKTVFARGYGLADVDGRAEVTTATNFRLASLSKQFTATAAMMLVAGGSLMYDDDITQLVKGLPAWAKGVQVRHLLHHTSGLPDYEDFVPDTQTTQVSDADVPVLISKATSPQFAPGTKYHYSNTGYALLALVVERVSGQRYADFLRTNLFAPLGMTNTLAFEDGRSPVPSRAYGHSVRDGVVRRTDQSSTSAVLGDGGIYSSISDLAKWVSAIASNRLVTAEQQRLAWTPPTLGGVEKSDYGFGWFVDRIDGLRRLRHHGETRGFTNGIVMYPDRGVAVVVLTNRSGGAPWDLAQRIAELHLGVAEPAAAWRP